MRIKSRCGRVPTMIDDSAAPGKKYLEDKSSIVLVEIPPEKKHGVTFSSKKLRLSEEIDKTATLLDKKLQFCDKNYMENRTINDLLEMTPGSEHGVTLSNKNCACMMKLTKPQNYWIKS